ncbi:hypothetical protein EJB05_39903, partial [Eragrostis curvula]
MIAIWQSHNLGHVRCCGQRGCQISELLTMNGDLFYAMNGGFKSIAAMALRKLSELTTKGPPCAIKVKVIRLWDSINNRTDELMSLDMILIDEKGDVIHATIGKNLIDTYRPQIRESAIYSFSNFRVQDSLRYRPVSNELKIAFNYNTKVKEVKEQSKKFQENYFEFASNDTLKQRENKDNQLCDWFTYHYFTASTKDNNE